MGNPQRVMAALKPYPEKYVAIRDKYFPGMDLKEGSQEWFRFLIDHIL
jgi:hypothetical protein